MKRKKEQRKKWQAKYLQKLGVTEAELEDSPEKMEKEEETQAYKNLLKKTEEKYHRPVTASK